MSKTTKRELELTLLKTELSNLRDRIEKLDDAIHGGADCCDSDCCNTFPDDPFSIENGPYDSDDVIYDFTLEELESFATQLLSNAGSNFKQDIRTHMIHNVDLNEHIYLDMDDNRILANLDHDFLLREVNVAVNTSINEQADNIKHTVNELVTKFIINQ